MKTFDKVSQDKLMETFPRLMVPHKLTSLICSLFSENPQFKVQIGSIDVHEIWSKLLVSFLNSSPLYISPYITPFKILDYSSHGEHKRQETDKNAL